MPMLQARWKPHDIAGTDFFDGTPLTLHPSETGRDDQRLSERCVCHAVRAPGSKVTWPPLTLPGSGAWNRGSTRTDPVNQSGDPFAEGREPFLLMSMSIFVLLCTFEFCALAPNAAKVVNPAAATIACRREYDDMAIETASR